MGYSAQRNFNGLKMPPAEKFPCDHEYLVSYLSQIPSSSHKYVVVYLSFPTLRIKHGQILSNKNIMKGVRSQA